MAKVKFLSFEYRVHPFGRVTHVDVEIMGKDYRNRDRRWTESLELVRDEDADGVVRGIARAYPSPYLYNVFKVVFQPRLLSTAIDVPNVCRNWRTYFPSFVSGELDGELISRNVLRQVRRRSPRTGRSSQLRRGNLAVYRGPVVSVQNSAKPLLPGMLGLCFSDEKPNGKVDFIPDGWTVPHAVGKSHLRYLASGPVVGVQVPQISFEFFDYGDDTGTADRVDVTVHTATGIQTFPDLNVLDTPFDLGKPYDVYGIEFTPRDSGVNPAPAVGNPTPCTLSTATPGVYLTHAWGRTNKSDVNEFTEYWEDSGELPEEI